MKRVLVAVAAFDVVKGVPEEAELLLAWLGCLPERFNDSKVSLVHCSA
jgi:hypothetical protein